MSVGKLKIIYDPDGGKTLPDGKIGPYIDELITFVNDGMQTVATVGGELFIYYVQLAVKQGRLTPEQVVIEYKLVELRLNSDGRISYYPEGFCTHADKILCELLGW